MTSTTPGAGPQGRADAGYPPEPWYLRGDMVVQLRTLDADLAIERLPRGLTPVLRRGQTLAGVAWVDYRPTGVLAYRELLVAVAVLHGARPSVCVTDIWVDSVASLQGGRELWGIPKELAEFPTFDGTRFSITPTTGPGADGRAEAASATWRPACSGSSSSSGSGSGRRSVWPPSRLPFRLPTRYSLVQDLDGRLVRSRVRSTGIVEFGEIRLDVDPAGPLGHLTHGRPLRSLAVRDFRLRFGG